MTFDDDAHNNFPHRAFLLYNNVLFILLKMHLQMCPMPTINSTFMTHLAITGSSRASIYLFKGVFQPTFWISATEVLQSTKYLETFRENRFRKEVEMRRDRQKVKCWRKFGLTVQKVSFFVLFLKWLKCFLGREILTVQGNFFMQLTLHSSVSRKSAIRPLEPGAWVQPTY